MHPSQFRIHLYRPDAPMVFSEPALAFGHRFFPFAPADSGSPDDTAVNDASAAGQTPAAEPALAVLHLPAGTIVHLNGCPLELSHEVLGHTHPSNVRQMLDNAVAPPAPPASFGDPPANSPGAGVTTANPSGTQAFIGASRRPLRDWVRDRIIAAVLLEVPHGTSVSRIEAVLADVAKERPLLDWLANGGVEKLVTLILALLKLAA